MATKISRHHKSVKHDIIDKDNTRTVAAVAFATFVIVFSIFAAKALISQSLYHSRVTSGKEAALDQLKENKDAISDLKQSFDDFSNETTNILGGNSTGTDALDGNNAQLVLDALPKSYDYPALSSSFEKILKDGGYDIDSIGGSEQSSANGSQSSSSGTSFVSAAIEIPYSFSFTASTERTQDLLETIERSIRPMHVDSIRIQVGENTLRTNLSLHTFYAQEKSFNLGSKEIK